MKKQRHTVAAIAVVASLGLAVAGCSATSSGNPSAAHRSGGASGQSVRETSTTVLSKYVNTVSLRTGVVTTSCKAAPGGWEASGSIHNSSHKDHDYQLTVYFTDAQATVLGSARTSSNVAAGQAGSWNVNAQFNAPSQVNCVLVGVG